MDVTTYESNYYKGNGDPVHRVTQLKPALSWGAIFAGAFIAVLTYLGLSALGLALGALSLEHAVEAGEGGRALTLGSGIWMILSVVGSLFVGGFVAARAHGIIPTRIGAIGGLVVAGLFFVTLFVGVGAGMSLLGRAAGSLASALGSGAVNAAQSEQVGAVVNEALADLNLRNQPAEIVQTTAGMLLAGNVDGAASYLARQTDAVTEEQARERLAGIQGQISATASEVTQRAAFAIQIAAWVAFITIVLASGGALFGGVLGARRNLKHPITERDRKVALEARREWTATRTTTSSPVITTEEPLPGPT